MVLNLKNLQIGMVFYKRAVVTYTNSHTVCYVHQGCFSILCNTKQMPGVFKMFMLVLFNSSSFPNNAALRLVSFTHRRESYWCHCGVSDTVLHLRDEPRCPALYCCVTQFV